MHRVHEQHVVALRARRPSARSRRARRARSACQSRVAQRSLTRDDLLDLVARTRGTRRGPARDGYSIATNTTRPRTPGARSSSRSYARKPRTMFFDGSMRSLRSDHEPVADAASSSVAAAAAPSAIGRDSRERVDVGPERRGERAARRGARAEHRRAPTPVGARPARRCGSRAGTAASDAHSSLGRRRSGSTRIEFGPAERRVGEVHDAQVGPRRAQHARARARAGSPARARCRRRRARARRPRRRTPRSPRRTRPTPRGSGGRSAAGGRGRTGRGAGTTARRSTTTS